MRLNPLPASPGRPPSSISHSFLKRKLTKSVDLALVIRGCTFYEFGWRVLAPFWYPVAFSHEVSGRPCAVTLLGEHVVFYCLSNGSLRAARDMCHHRGVPLSASRGICGWLDMFSVQERQGLVWVRLMDNGSHDPVHQVERFEKGWRRRFLGLHI